MRSMGEIDGNIDDMDKMNQKGDIEHTLHNIGIIITRPKGQGLWLAEQIRKHGMQPFSLPGLEIAPVQENADITMAKAQIKQYDYLLFTSPNAVIYAHYFQIPLESAKGIIALGQGTEKTLRQFVQQQKIITAPKPYTSEALIHYLQERQLVTHRSVLIMSGAGGRRLLAKAIEALGGKAQYCDLYYRKKPTHLDFSAIQSFKNSTNGHPKQLYLIISSQEAFTNLLPEITSNGIRSSINAIFVASDRLQNIVKSEGFENIIVAKSALESDLWQAIEEQLRSQTSDLDSPLTISSDNDKELSMTKKEQKQNKKSTTDTNVVTSNENLAERSADSSNDSATLENTPSPETTVDSVESSDNSVNTVAQDEATSKYRDVDHNQETNHKDNRKDHEDSKSSQESNSTDHPSNDSQTIPRSTRSTGNGGKVVGYIALLVALAAAGVSGFSIYQTEMGKTSKDDQLSALQTTIEGNQNHINAFTTNLNKLQTEIEVLKKTTTPSIDAADDSIQGQVTLLAQKYDSLNDTLAQSAKGLQTQIDTLKADQQSLTEKSAQIDNIAKVSNQAITIANNFDKKLAEQDLKQAVVLDEAKELITTIKSITDLEMLRTTEVDYLLKVALQKAEHDKDYKGAAELLSTAVDRLNEINNINFTETKQLLESNIADLKALTPVDMMMITDRLEKIASLIQHAPLKSDSVLVNLKKEIFDQQPDGGDSWHEKLRNSLKHLIVIEDKRAEVPELMAKEDRFFLIQNIQLELTSAKIAAQQDQFDLFDHTLDTVKSWITTYFDEDNADVREALKQIQWMIDAKFETTPPNIQRTLTDFEATLRAYKGA